MNRTAGRPHALLTLPLLASALIATAIVAFADVSPARAATASLPANATVTGIGSIVNVDLTLSSATGTEAADIDITYTASVVRVAADAVIGPLGANAQCQVTTNAATLGVVRFGVACVGATASGGVLLTIPFQAFAPGVSDLTVTRCSLNEDGIACPTGGTGKITVSVATPTSPPLPPTVTRTPTATLVPPTPTRTRTVTATVPPPTATMTRTRTATFTAAPPTATRTRTGTATITRTAAPPPPTATRTSTRTSTPVAIPTPSMSALAILASAPTTMTAGQQNVVTVTMRNNGNTTWTAAQGYKLGSANPQDNFTWGMNRVALGASDSIAPGQDKVFSWAVTAPATAGVYNFQWRMVREGVAWFGANTTNIAVIVNGPAPTVTRTPLPATATRSATATATRTNPPASTSTRPPIATSTRPPSTSTPIATATRTVPTATRTVTATFPPVVTDGAFVSQSVPTTMVAGQPVNVSVTMRNTGTTTWSAGNLYKLGAINPYDNFTWGMNRVTFGAADRVAPGQQKTFTWTVTAPAEGTYNFQWRLVIEGVVWFGETTPNVVVTVGAAQVTPPNATFVAQMFPTTVLLGQSFTASVTMRNTGGTTWTAAQQYRLGSINPVDTPAWGANRVNLAPGESIAPGQEKTFTWTATSPPAAGFYNFQWRMVQDGGVGFFGQSTTNLVITVPQS